MQDQSVYHNSEILYGWVVDRSMDHSMRAPLVNDALLMAIWSRKPQARLLWHTDHSSQYASGSHRAILAEHKIKQSISRKENC